MLGTFSDVSLLSYQSWTDEAARGPSRHPVPRGGRHRRQASRLEAPARALPRQPALLSAPRSSVCHDAARHRRDGGRRRSTIHGRRRRRWGSSGSRTARPRARPAQHRARARRCGGPATPAPPGAQLMWLDGTKLRREELALCRRFDLVLTPSDREREVLEAEGDMPPVATVPNTIDTDQLALFPPPSPTDGPHSSSSVPPTSTPTGTAWCGSYERCSRSSGARCPTSCSTSSAARRRPTSGPRRRTEGAGARLRARPRSVPRHGQRVDRAVAGRWRHPPQDPQRAGPRHPHGLDARSAPKASTSRPAGICCSPTIPRSFADAVLRLSATRRLRARLRVAGRQFVEEHYDWRMVQDRLRTVIESTLAERALPSPA